MNWSLPWEIMYYCLPNIDAKNTCKQIPAVSLNSCPNMTAPSKSHAHTLNLPHTYYFFQTNRTGFPPSTCHSCKFTPTDYDLFPSQTLLQPRPVVTPSNQEEWVIQDIVDEWARGRGKQYLVRWTSWGDEENRWLPDREVANTEALDKWLTHRQGA